MHRAMAALGFLLLMGGGAHAHTYVVRPDGTGDFPTIQAAVSAAASGDVISLTPGTFRGAGNRGIDYGGKAITVRSQNGDASHCIIDCESADRGFTFHTQEGLSSVLEKVTITNGRAMNGGGVHCEYCSPTLEGCIFSANAVIGSSALGGGLYCSGASPVVSDCVFLNNTASEGTWNYGGGAYCETHSLPRIIRCTFTGNHVGGSNWAKGAALYLVYSSPLLQECVFQNNLADGGSWAYGGAVAVVYDSHPAMRSCVFSQNAVHGTGWSYGGAVCCSEGPALAITSCTFFGNVASGGNSALGGGIYLDAGCVLTLDRSIIAFGDGGGAVYCDGTATLSCCDIYHNDGGDWTGSIASQNGIRGNFSLNPLFCDANAGNLHLQPNSPCGPGHDPDCGLIGALPNGCTAGDAPEPIAAGIGGDLLARPRPNPFRDRVEIACEIPVASAREWVRVAVYDAAGRIVRTLMEGRPGAGRFALHWDGEDALGRGAEGIFFCRLSIGGEIETRSMVRVR